MSNSKFHFTISLAQWSLNKSFFSKEIDTLDFPRIARERYNISAVEYVNQFFIDKAEDKEFLQQLKNNARAAQIKNVLIMIDHEGELAAANPQERHKAVEGHKKWIDAAAFLECDAVRVNLHGFVSETEWVQGSIESLKELGIYAQQFNVKVLVENHGGLSAKINLLMDVIQNVNLPNVGTMPDFGNFCIRREVPGDLWTSACIEHYDPYQGVQEMLSFAGAISAKTYDIDEHGNEPNIDFERMMTLIKNSGYQGYIGVEYEGERLSEDEGIRLSKILLERWKL
jgi:sugar phosphate isomerase/epimerase